MALLRNYILLPIILSFICIAKSADPSGNFCNDQSTTNNILTLSNINTLLTKLVQTTYQNDFSALSYGKPNDQIVYGLAQCRGDVSTKDCSACVQEAAKEIRNRCPTHSDARIWYDYCFLRYSTKDFRGQVDTGFGFFFCNVENVDQPEFFYQKLGSLIDQIEGEALVLMNKGLGKGESKVLPFVNVYGMVQCTRDLSKLSCAQCLAMAVGKIPNVCNNKKGCRLLYSSCLVRYEIYPFYFPLNASGSGSVVKGIMV